MNRIKELRKQKGKTLDQMQDETGIKRGTLNNYENGKTEPKLETWQKLADYFDVPVSYLQGISYSYEQLFNAINTEISDIEKELIPIFFDNKEVKYVYSKTELRGYTDAVIKLTEIFINLKSSNNLEAKQSQYFFESFYKLYSMFKDGELQENMADSMGILADDDCKIKFHHKR